MDGKISYSAICAAFEGDDEIDKYCDPGNKNPTPKGVIDDVFEKLVDYETLVDGVFKTIKSNEKEVGFVYYFDNVLVSFGVNKNYRNKAFLKSVFEDVKDWMNGDFVAYMWERNERSVKWLEKCGMEKEPVDLEKIIKLRYKSCL
jgi:RimJ/RimL family protein N-acetyltransferase